MKRAFALAAVSLFAVGCGGDAASAGPAKSPDDAAAAAADAPAADAPAPAADAPAADKPADKPAAGTDDGAWAGEAEAKSSKAPADGKTETRTMEVIAQVVKDNRKPVRECFDKAKKDLPDLKGDMVIHFVVDPDGKVKKAELNQERSSIKSPAVVDCSIKVIQAIKFPPSSRGMDTTVNYPFNFN
ncbi:MAG TPA: AgmX/PglI C-terminal domain-containing protein [Polyangiaceae bacterium]|nr:AgmX/PglI C-terminal domain-containing protein [Polyangiaceae bacterium]